MSHDTHTYSAFDGDSLLASGPLHIVAIAIKRAIESSQHRTILTYDDTTGRAIDFDTRGTDEEIEKRFAPPAPPIMTEESAVEPRGRGRPKLGVIAHEITLLPRHWDWLSAQPGGASVAVRKLVEEARKTADTEEQIRKAREAAYCFMSAMAGNLPNFEEATRALFRHDRNRFLELIADWPQDVCSYSLRLAFPENR